MINPMDLTGKHVLITGASSGIGRECAVQASRLGAHVTMIARSEDKLRETLSFMDRPEKHLSYSLDLNRTEEIETLVERIVQDRGAVDGLVHAAGIVIGRPVKMTTPAFMESMLRIHLEAFAELVRSLCQKKRLNNGASVVGISSASVDRGDATWAAYAAAKAGMNGFIRSAAVELGKREIRINNVAFAMVGTNSYYDFLENSASSYERIMGPQYLGPVSLEGAANTVMFLLSDAVRQITGSVLEVYAGR